MITCLVLCNKQFLNRNISTTCQGDSLHGEWMRGKHGQLQMVNSHSKTMQAQISTRQGKHTLDLLSSITRNGCRVRTLPTQWEKKSVASYVAYTKWFLDYSQITPLRNFNRTRLTQFIKSKKLSEAAFVRRRLYFKCFHLY